MDNFSGKVPFLVKIEHFLVQLNDIFLKIQVLYSLSEFFKLAERCYLKNQWGNNGRNVLFDSSKVYQFYEQYLRKPSELHRSSIYIKNTKATTDTLDRSLRKLRKL